MIWAEHIAPMGQMSNAYQILVGNPEWNGPLGRRRRGLVASGSEQGQVAGSCEHEYETSGYIKGRELLA